MITKTRQQQLNAIEKLYIYKKKIKYDKTIMRERVTTKY